MPLSEFLRLAMEKLEASKKKSCSTDHSVSRMENDLVEVVWEDTPTHHSLSPTTPNVLDATLTTECVGGVDSMLDDISPVVASEEFDLSQNYVVDDGVQDYFSEILGGKAKETSGSKRSSDEATKYLDNEQDASKFSSRKALSLSSWPPQQGRTSRLSGVSTINRQDVMFGNGFSKHEAVVQPNLPISGGISSPGAKRMKVKETDPACRCSNLVKSMLLTQNTGLDGDRNVEPVFASSSVGSGNSGDRVSYDETLKRKLCDIESECLSDDIQTESVGVEKLTAVGGDTVGAKKSRTTQVHNLSERRRRDRINEKMSALQQLIPNCNKADKASMLDDAIQYLKNLQHQVQSMSMGGGLCVPQMMFAPGSQHVYPAPIPHYSPMGMGMSYHPIFPVHANFQGTPIDGQLCPRLHSLVPSPPSIPFAGPLRTPTTSLHLNFEDPTKSNSHNAEASNSINRANNQ